MDTIGVLIIVVVVVVVVVLVESLGGVAVTGLFGTNVCIPPDEGNRNLSEGLLVYITVPLAIPGMEIETGVSTCVPITTGLEFGRRFTGMEGGVIRGGRKDGTGVTIGTVEDIVHTTGTTLVCGAIDLGGN